MNPALLGVLIAGGVVVVTDDETARVAPVPTPRTGTTRIGAFISTRQSLAPGSASGTPLVWAPSATTMPNGMDADSESLIRAQLEKEYETLSGDAKRAACERLKDQFPDDSNVQALDCANADFQKVLNVVGAAVGTALCGPGCGALGIIAAEYFGEDINALWNDLTSDPCVGFRLYVHDISENACSAWRAKYGDDWLRAWTTASDATRANWAASHK